nr:D-xylose-proton symporter-like 2 [Ipomoea batatas]
MYIAETSPSQIRGLLISLKEFLIVFGMLLGYTVGSLMVEVVAGWRYVPTPILAIIDVQPKELGIPTKDQFYL